MPRTIEALGNREWRQVETAMRNEPITVPCEPQAIDDWFNKHIRPGRPPVQLSDLMCKGIVQMYCMIYPPKPQGCDNGQMEEPDADQ